MRSSNNAKIDPASCGIDRLPKHVAVIMDGNGRWAKKRGWIRLQGHKEGAKSVKRTLEMSYKLGIRHLTLFAFSAQNWQRPQPEVEGLMSLLMDYLRGEQEKLMAQGIRFRAIGEIDKLPAKLQTEIREFEQRSIDNTEMDLIVALSYGSREEIVHAVKRIAQEVADGTLDPKDVDEAAISGRLYTSDLPDPDLLIRTSGEMRVSNFMLWQLAYAEFHITDVLWPDFGEEDLLTALRAFGQRERRFGKTGEQVTKKKKSLKSRLPFGDLF